jgi:hypothetical protein
MKPAPACTLGLITGLGLFAAFNFWRTAPQLSVISVPLPPPAHTQSTSTSSAVFASAQPASTPDIPQDPLESALREIREAGMVVIPQEFARFLMPSLVSTRPEPAVRAILQLDDREASALAKARVSFDSAIQKAIDSHLEVIEVKDGVVTATIPAFKEERQKLINAWRIESLAGLDAESAAIAAHIDFDRAIEGFYSQGNMEAIVTFKRSENTGKTAIEYKGQTANGDHRQNWNFRTSIPDSQLLKRYPSLRPHFPQLAEEPKP